MSFSPSYKSFDISNSFGAYFASNSSFGNYSFRNSSYGQSWDYSYNFTSSRDSSYSFYKPSYNYFGSLTSYKQKKYDFSSISLYKAQAPKMFEIAGKSGSAYEFKSVGSIKGDTYFDDALKFVLKWEGGYANVKGDSGGETNKGITHATYQAWLKKNGMPSKSVKNITDNEVRQIYYNEFWKPLGCDKLPSKVALFMFDTGVNMGVGRAKEYLKRYNNGESLDSLVKARDNRYDAIVANNPEKRKFRAGWDNRMTDLKSTMLAVA